MSAHPHARPDGRSRCRDLRWLVPVLALTALAACRKQPSAADAAAAPPPAVPAADVPAPAAAVAPDGLPAGETPRPTPADAPDPPPSPPVSGDVRCEPGEPVGPPPELPEQALVLFRTAPPQGPASGFRLLADGTLQTLGTDGTWTAGRTFEGDELDRLRTTVQEAALSGLAPAYRRAEPGPPVATVWLAVRGPDGPRAVCYDEPCFLPEVHALMLRLVEVFD
jgi:hypothetical protein